MTSRAPQLAGPNMMKGRGFGSPTISTHSAVYVAPSRSIACPLNMFRCCVPGRRNNSRPSVLNEKVVEVNDSLIELHRPSGTPSAQVLFFHGLPFEKSSSLEVHLNTWECGDGSYNLWPQTWLVEEFPDAHVFVIRYSQGLREDSRKTFDMKNVAENLLSDLMQGKIGQVQGCPVVLVGHSVGGLIIKSLCLEAHERLHLSTDSRNNRVQQLENFLNRIGGIFSYCTPHHGIPHINKAAGYLDGPLFKYFHILSTDAARLNSNFSRLRTRYAKWQIKGLAENLAVQSGVSRGIVVVPEASAREEELNVETADHFSVSKPPSKTSRRFNAMAGFLHNVLNQPKEDAGHKNLQYVPKQIQGIDSALQEVKERLKNVTRLCLTGMGGLGKTTLAKVVFNDLAPKFEYSCFVPDVQLIEQNEEVLKAEIWKYMYHNGKKVGGESDWSSVRGRELLLVLDDISIGRDQNVLSEIADSSSSQSRFIATSRHLRLFDNTYPVPLLNADYAQQLFVSRAFPTQVIPPNLVSIVKQIVKKCECLPLTLEVVAQHLRGRQEEEDWKQALDTLGKADAVSDFEGKLWEKLRLSYNGLQEKEKQIFLDATTFFSMGYPRYTLRHAKIAWREAYKVSENTVWRMLVERSLVYDVNEDEFIKVHEQLRSMGQKIASETNYLRRVWERPKVLEILQSTNESEKQTIHSLRLWDSTGAIIQVAIPNLQQLENLRYLQVKDRLVIEANLDDKWFPRDLVLLDCIGLQLFDPARQSRLVILELTDIDAEHLPNSIGQLSCLRIFILSGARELHSLPDGIGQLSQLESLLLRDCTNLETLPETFGELSNLKKLTLSNCFSLRTLPESFGNLSALDFVKFKTCKNLQTLPDSFGRLSKLTTLKIIFCHRFHSLPESFGNLSALDLVRLTICHNLQTLPDSFGRLSKLTSLTILSCNGFHSLPESFGDLPALESLAVRDCHKLESLPDSFGRLPALTDLEFRNCDFTSLPESFGQLISLSHLTLDDCRNLRSLPDSFGNLTALRHLTLAKCGNLHSLPDSLGQLAKLEYLLILGASELESLPTSLAALKALRHLVIKSTSINSIPDDIGKLPLLQTLELGLLDYVKELPRWLGETGRNTLACSQKTFQVRYQHFSLIEDKVQQQSETSLVQFIHARCMEKVSKLDYAGALAALSVSNLGEPVHQGFVLQEKGIVKRMMGDLRGALEYLTAALETFSTIEDGDSYTYDCWKHRGYVNCLMGNLESAESDGTMALKLQLEYRRKKWIPTLDGRDVAYMSPSLGEEQVMYMHFQLEGWKEIVEYTKLWESLHYQVMQTVMAPGTEVGDFQTALASFKTINPRLLRYQKRAFFLRERGILKRMSGDLVGALEDLTAALTFHTMKDDYNCLKHRGFVKYLQGDMEGARMDANRALTWRKVLSVKPRRSLGQTTVTYLDFELPPLQYTTPTPHTYTYPPH